MIKGLDDFITGKNDPNAPFNQVDWDDQFHEVLDECEEITEEILDEDYNELGIAMMTAFEEVASRELKNERMSYKQIYKFVTERHNEIRQEFRNRYKVLKFWKALNCNPINSPIAFNAMCFEQAKKIGLDENIMNRVISIWTCTKQKEFPVNYFKTLLR